MIKLAGRMDLICCKCGKIVANADNVDGITTWFAVCSECLFGVKGWTKEELNKVEETRKNEKMV